MQNSSLDINLEQRSYNYNNNNKYLNNPSNSSKHSLSRDRLRFPIYNSRNFKEAREAHGQEQQETSTADDDSLTRVDGSELKEELEFSNSETKGGGETEEYYSTDDTNERMQLDTSTDFYDDNDEEDEDEDNNDDDDDDDDDDVYVDESSESFEMIPEAKKLIQSPENEDELKNNPKMEKYRAEDEEEDMGYDEDDERIAAERSSSQQNRGKDEEKGYMNEEGSGVDTGYKSSSHNDNRFSLAYLRNKQKKGQRASMTAKNTENNRNGQEVDTRESSGNFANDDDEDDDDDDDHDDDDDEDGSDGGEKENGNHDNENDGKDSNEFFNAKRAPNNRYFRKNTNDAIKIISTPLGKVGIVYQQTPTQNEDNVDKKPATSLTDFDALSPDPDSSSRLASSHPKITPVLTPDGKVALLYRGDSENTKYEPIRNLTHKFIKNNNNNNNNTFDSKESATNNNNKQENTLKLDRDDSSSNSEDSIDSNYDNTDDDDDDNRREDENSVNRNNKLNIVPPSSSGTGGGSGNSFIVRPTDSILPMINKPLSEVLGIKKNQFKQFRVKDIMLSTTSTDSIIPRTLPAESENNNNNNNNNKQQQSTTNLHFLTKVNLAEYPTTSIRNRNRNRDFDFSQDNTMLDERSRNKAAQQESSSNDIAAEEENSSIRSNSDIDQFTNEEMLSKTEVVDLAIIPHFVDNDLNDRYNRRQQQHHRNRQLIHRRKQNDEDLSGIHCIMQIMMGIAAISTVFGMLGTFFKQRILDQLRLMHW